MPKKYHHYFKHCTDINACHDISLSKLRFYIREGGHAHIHAFHAAYILQKPIGYKTKISTDGVEWSSRVNIWIVRTYSTSFNMV